jgi:hypothetical protein
MDDTTATETKTVLSIFAEGQLFSVATTPENGYYVEMTVGGPEGQWWGRSCTRREILKFADFLLSAADGPHGTIVHHHFDGGYTLSVSSEELLEDAGGALIVPRSMVQISGYDSFEIGAYLLFHRTMAVAICHGIWSVVAEQNGKDTA